MLSTTTRYFYDGVNEIVETDDSGDRLCYYVHGISYVDERLMMLDYKDTSVSTDDRPYYFTVDRMYNVRMVVDRAGAIVERYAYDPYGRPLIREAPGRGDMNNDNLVDRADASRFVSARTGSIWDPRADMDDDGDVDSGQFAQDARIFTPKQVSGWPPFLPYPPPPNPTVAQAFSDVGNPFMFQGRPHFALDTGASATVGELMINDHRGRKRTIGSDGWDTRDPLWYNLHIASLRSSSNIRSLSQAGAIFEAFSSNPIKFRDPSGLSVDCGPLMCGCSSGDSPVSVYGDSARARLILGLAGHTDGCVTLLIPPGIFCTGSCADILQWTAGQNVPLLDHECCHWCDWIDDGLCKYLDGAINDNCDSRPKTGDPSW